MLSGSGVQEINLVQNMGVQVLDVSIEPSFAYVVEKERSLQPRWKVRKIAQSLIIKRNLKD